ncbi:Growth arrest-specific protein 8, partial [Globisporangium splendens]
MAHEKAFGEIKNYYNDITHNNLDLIKSLKEEVSEMKKEEAQDEKLMFEISQENKRMSEPLKRALQDAEKLRKNIKVYQEEHIELHTAKAQLLVLEEEYATLSWDDQFQRSIYDVQQKTGLKNLLLEEEMDVMMMRLEQKDAELNEVLLHVKLEPAIVDHVKDRLDDIMANKSQDLREPEKEVVNVARLQKELASAMELKMSEYGLPFDELGYRQVHWGCWRGFGIEGKDDARYPLGWRLSAFAEQNDRRGEQQSDLSKVSSSTEG